MTDDRQKTESRDVKWFSEGDEGLCILTEPWKEESLLKWICRK